MFDEDEIDDDEEDGWKILKPGVVLFETTIGFVDSVLYSMTMFAGLFSARFLFIFI